MAAKRKLAEHDIAEEHDAQGDSKYVLLVKTTHNGQIAYTLDPLHLYSSYLQGVLVGCNKMRHTILQKTLTSQHFHDLFPQVRQLLVEETNIYFNYHLYVGHTGQRTVPAV
jgi:hypothetical protein